MSASSTVTQPSKRKTASSATATTNGRLSTDDIKLPPDSERDPLEVKHRDFFWTYTEEPHRTRRLAIIKAHPEVTKLCGPEPLTKYVVAGVVSLQIFLAYTLRNTSFFDWKFWAVGYIFGATANQNLFLAIHEISHNLAFRSPLANRLIAIIANLPIGVPYSASFRPYHLTHHKSLGVDGLDTDLSSFLAGSLHPLAGHFIAEHYVYETVTPEQRDPNNAVPVPETFSYYGPLNFLTYNVGLHNEHHDFPAVPWTRLPKLKAIAHEFYDDLPRHESWSYAIWRFIFDENVGINSRVKRKEGGRKVGGGAKWKQDEIEA
ncbi:hypothetical protein BN1708_005313 [Verticillium longisporum]|uniref:Sphingolipid delta4-desaturase N-terminal domain-containing protein n=1 Tax=Verticillium longisporum TaxID=100787 RepID=A0A0G4M9C7_VERLO|nr:hypothetical protein BN1708_005313 [Verticillium longisporum]